LVGVTRLQRSLYRLAPGPPLVLLWLIVVSFVAAVIAARYQGLAGPWLWNFDMPKIDYPLASFYHDALRAGRLPLWNDQLGLGYPLYAEGQIGAFYPPNWLLFQFTPLIALDLSRIVHLTIAGVGTGWLVLRVSGSRTGAVVAALVAVLGGAITAKLEWHNLVAAYAYVPWILVPLVRRPAPTRAGLVGAGVLFGIQALTGHPNTWLLTGFTAVLVMLATNPWPTTLLRIVAFGLIGVGVGAVQLVPTIVLTTLSVRSTGLSSQDLFASGATPFDILGLAFQGAFVRVEGGAWDPWSVWYPDGTFALYEAAWYVGFPVLGLAAIGATTQRARPLAIAALILVAVAVIAGFQPEPWAAIPILNGLRSPTRAYVFVALLLGVLAGIGVGRLGRGYRTLLRTVVAVAAPLIAYGLVVAMIRLSPGSFVELLLESSSFRPDDVANRLALAELTLTAAWPLGLDLAAALAIVVVVAFAGRFPRGRLLLAPAAVLVAAVPLVVLGPLPNSVQPINAFSYAGSDFVRAVAATNPHRVLTLSPPGFYSGSPDQLAAARIPDLRMFSSLDLEAVTSITDQAGQDVAVDLRRALGVDLIVTFDRPCPGGVVIGASAPDKATLCRIDALHPPYWIPESAVSVGATPASAIKPQDAEVDLTAVGQAINSEEVSRDETGLSATIEVPGSGWVWIDRAWWPAWHTTVDGVGVPVSRAFGGQLVHVDAGRHVIRQWLLPWEALIGLVMGVAALGLAAIWLGGLRAVRSAGVS
jgi:hypothetical protein